MGNSHYEQHTVAEVLKQLPEAQVTFRSYGIDPTNRLSLAQAAAAVSVTPDALLAELEYRTRRAAQRVRRQERREEHVELYDEELVEA